MAIVENFWLKGQTKKLGGSVIYQAMGQTRQRALASSVSNPRTQAQMNQRVKWANLVNLYRANSSWMKYAFETKKASQSDYNKFMSLNVTNSNIFLTKNIAAAGGCVVQGYQVTQGSLPSIETTYDAGFEGWLTNIFLGPNVELNTTSVAAFTQMLLNNNPALQEGDQISFIRLTQMTNADSGYPYVIVRKYEVILSLTNSTSLWDYIPQDYIDSDEGAEMSRLMVKDSGNAGGFALILSRTKGGKTFVSSQRIIVANNAELIAAYSSQSALNAAIASYGESDEPFLSSTSANTAQDTFVPSSITLVRVGSTDHIPGTFWKLDKSQATQEVVIKFSSPVSAEAVNVLVYSVSGGGESSITLANAQITDGQISATMPAATGLPTNNAVDRVVVVLDSVNIIETGFIVPNEYTIQGLE